MNKPKLLKLKLLLLMPLALLTACASRQIISDAACANYSQAPIQLTQPLPSVSYSTLVQKNIESWERSLTDTLRTLEAAPNE